MLPQGYLTRYTTSGEGVTIYIQSITDPTKQYTYHFAATKHGEQMLRRYLNITVRKQAKRTFSSRVSNKEIMDVLILTNQMKGLIK